MNSIKSYNLTRELFEARLIEKKLLMDKNINEHEKEQKLEEVQLKIKEIRKKLALVKIEDLKWEEGNHKR